MDIKAKFCLLYVCRVMGKSNLLAKVGGVSHRGYVLLIVGDLQCVLLQCGKLYDQLTKELQMRLVAKEEICNISGGEATCTIGVPAGVSCTGTLSELGQVAVKAYAFLSLSPVSVPGIIERLRN